MCLRAASYYHYKSEDGRESSSTRPSSAGSMQVYTPSTLNRTTASNSPSNNVAIKSGGWHRGVCDRPPPQSGSGSRRLFLFADSLLFNRIDERLRLARERRGELEKQNGAYLCPFCNTSCLNLLGSCGEVPIALLHKVLAPPVAMALGLRNRSGIGTLFRKASFLSCDFVCVWFVTWSGRTVGPCCVFLPLFF